MTAKDTIHKLFYIKVCTNNLPHLLSKTKMLDYDRIHVVEGIDANKADSSRKCIICQC